MDHPNAIYFVLAAHGFITVMGGFFLAGAMGVGPFGTTAEAPRLSQIMSSRTVKAFVGLPALLLGAYATLGHVLTLWG